MSSFGSQTRKRLRELKKIGADIPRIINEVAEAATIEAVRAATEATPPNDGAIRGTNTSTGDLAGAWARDSVTTPTNGVTELNANLQYASYVNDGHRMDEHFTSHVAIEGGVLVKKPAGDGGLVVGTQTSYVQGKYMKEKAVGKYRNTVKKMLERKVREKFK